jgi:hypothetical protein
VGGSFPAKLKPDAESILGSAPATHQATGPRSRALYE